MTKSAALMVVIAVAAIGGVSALRRTSDVSPSLSAKAQAGHDVSDVLYQTNCGGCHGADGEGGAARGLIDSVYLSITNEGTMRLVTANGVPGTAMPAFSTEAGGALTDQQIDAVVRSIRTAPIRGDIVLDSTDAPPYSPSTPGDPVRGRDAFATFCARCHGADGRGGPGAGSIVDASYLALVSDQSLRTSVIAGRPDLGAPDWRGNVPGRPMLPDDVSDVVAWLAAQRGTHDDDAR